VRRWWRRRRVEQRAQLADDVRRLAGFADAAPGGRGADGVAACPLVWSHWADRLAATRPPEREQ
jgi:hypothetical protein